MKQPKRLKENDKKEVEEISTVNFKKRYKTILILFCIIAGLVVVQGAYIFFLIFQNNQYLEERDQAIIDEKVYGDKLEDIYDHTSSNSYIMRNYDYTVDYDKKEYNLRLQYSYSTYFKYKLNKSHDFSRGGGHKEVVEALESFCDANSVKEVAVKINSSCVNPSDKEELINALLGFVQDKGNITNSIHLISEINDVPKYPIETICEGNGDVEDKSILLASLLESLGFDTILVLTPAYCFVGVNMTAPPTHRFSGNTWNVTYKATKFYTCDTAIKNWRVGDLTKSLQNEVYYIAEVKC